MQNRNHLLAVAALVALIFATLVFSQTFDELDPSKTFAVLIGVSNYADTNIRSLRYAAADAQAVGDFLLSPRGGAIPPDHVYGLLEGDATKNAITTKLGFLGKNAPKDAVIYVFIAGHGDTPSGDLAYFIPADGDATNTFASGLNFDELRSLIEKGYAFKNATFRVLLSDVCHAGRMEDGFERTPEMRNAINQFFSGIRWTGPFLNLLASQPDEASFESERLGQGVFTYAVLQALNGRAAPNKGTVDAKSLVDYVTAEVSNQTKKQQNPMSNAGYDPRRTLAWTDRPGPAPPERVQASLVIMNANRTPYESVEWFDSRYRARAIRKLPKDIDAVELVGLPTGSLDFKFVDATQQTRKLTLPIKIGQNKLDILNVNLTRYRFEPPGLVQVAALRPVVPLQVPTVIRSLEATLTMRLPAGVTVVVGGSTFGTTAAVNEVLELSGLNPGVQELTLATATRESRFRLRLFAGSQIFDPETGELKYIVALQQDPAGIPLPADLPPNLAPVYRNFVLALFDERLIQPQGNSAWDFYQQLRNGVPAGLRDQLTERLIIAMGNRAQRIILKYLRGGDVRWNANTFDEGATLSNRIQQLFQFEAEIRQDIQSRQNFFTGRAGIERRQYAQAIQDLQRSINLFPQASHSYNAIGLAYWKQGLLQQAIAPLRQAINLSPRWTYPQNILALVLFELRQYNQAEQTFQGALQANPEDSTSHHGLAQLYLLEGRVADAEARLRLALTFNPGNAYAYETYGHLELRRNNSTEAERLYRLAIRLEPDEPSFRASLAALLARGGKIAEAQQIFGQIAMTDPSNLAVVRAYSAFLQAQTLSGQAAAVFEKAVKVEPNNSNLLVSYGELLRTLRKDKDAENQYRRAIKIASSNAYAHHDLASLYLSEGKVVQAERELAAAEKADPLFPNTPILLGQIRSAQKRFLEAIDAYNAALKLSVEPEQQEEIKRLLEQNRRDAATDAIQTARADIEKNRLKDAWAAYANGLKAAPEDSLLMEALLKFENEFASSADVSALPVSVVAAVLQTNFWASLRQAEALWKQDRPADGIRTFTEALDQISTEDRRKVTGTWFNLRNENYGIHQIVYRWASRMIERHDFDGAVKLMQSAIRLKIFDFAPDVSPVTIYSLMTPADRVNPTTFGEFLPLHKADRRAHEIFAVVYAAQKETGKSEEMLKALEPAQQLEVRRTIDRLTGSR